MRADSKPQPPSPRRLTTKRAAGRPRYYDGQDLMEVWLFVREQKVRLGWSANKTCQMGTFTFHVMGSKRVIPDYTVTHETLRSLYQKAVRLLKREGPNLAIWWGQVLAERLKLS